jgi:hypothetical protein
MRRRCRHHRAPASTDINININININTQLGHSAAKPTAKQASVVPE